MNESDSKVERLTVSVENDVCDFLRVEADKMGISLSKYCSEILSKSCNNILAEKHEEISQGVNPKERSYIANSIYKEQSDYSSVSHAIGKVSLETLLLVRSLAKHIIKSEAERAEIMAKAERQSKLSAHFMAKNLG